MSRSENKKEGRMKRELRYVVLKLKDVSEILTPKQMAQLEDICETVSLYRISRGAETLNCVVVESDWPEYEPVWKMIEERMDGKGG